MSASWTDERIASLKVLYADGLSSSQIGAELGVTRNAVIGKLHRIGLHRPNHPSSANTSAHPRHKPPPSIKRIAPTKSTHHTRVAAWRMAPVEEPSTPLDVTDDQIPLEQRKTIMQLENHHCRWPVGHPGTPDFFFCGHPSADLNIGIPYCRVHGARASAGPGRAPDRYPMWGANRRSA